MNDEQVDPMTALAAQLKAQGDMIAALQEQMKQSNEQNAKLMETNASLMAKLNRPAPVQDATAAPPLTQAEISEREQKAAWSALCKELGYNMEQ